MRKIMLILAVCVALTACKKEELTGTSFKKGQTVTITAGAGDDSNAKMHCLADLAFVWAPDDSILVTVNGKSSIFRLKSGMYSGTATFEGTMPADGTEFDIQYPVENPVLSDQTGNGAIIQDGFLKFTAEGCTTNQPCSLQLKSAIVEIPIEVTNVAEEFGLAHLQLTLTIGTKTYKNNNAVFSEGSFVIPYHFVVEPFPSSTVTFTVGYKGNTTYLVKTASNQACGEGNVLKMGKLTIDCGD